MSEDINDQRRFHEEAVVKNSIKIIYIGSNINNELSMGKYIYDNQISEGENKYRNQSEVKKISCITSSSYGQKY